MPCTRVFLCWRNDPDIIADRARDSFQYLQTRRIDAVIVGQQYTHQTIASNFVMPPIYGSKASGTTTLPSAR